MLIKIDRLESQIETDNPKLLKAPPDRDWETKEENTLDSLLRIYLLN